MSTPIASPAHHTDQVSKKWSASMPSVRRSASEPTVALIAIAASAPRNTMASASRTRRRSVSEPDAVEEGDADDRREGVPRGDQHAAPSDPD